MNICDLEKCIAECDLEIAEINQKKTALASQLEEKVIEENLRKKMGGLSDPEKKVLTKMIQPEGIESDEEFGEVS